MATYFYLRISTKESSDRQSFARQEKSLKAYAAVSYTHLCLAFSSDMYEEKMKYQVQYLDRYQVEVKNLNSEQTRLINLKDKSPEY